MVNLLLCVDFGGLLLRIGERVPQICKVIYVILNNSFLMWNLSMSRKDKIRRNSVCPCGCGRKFKICNEENRQKQREETEQKIQENMKKGRDAYNKLQLIAGVLRVHSPL